MHNDWPPFQAEATSFNTIHRCTHVENTANRVDFALFNLALYRLAHDVDVASLGELFPRISILG